MQTHTATLEISGFTVAGERLQGFVDLEQYRKTVANLGEQGLRLVCQSDTNPVPYAFTFPNLQVTSDGQNPTASGNARFAHYPDGPTTATQELAISVEPLAVRRLRAINFLRGLVGLRPAQQRGMLTLSELTPSL